MWNSGTLERTDQGVVFCKNLLNPKFLEYITTN